MKRRINRNDLIRLGHVIREYREDRGITIDELSCEMNLSKGNLSDIENAKKDPRFTTLALIASGLGISLSSLLRKF